MSATEEQLVQVGDLGMDVRSIAVAFEKETGY
jgi:hypothetical protein